MALEEDLVWTRRLYCGPHYGLVEFGSVPLLGENQALKVNQSLSEIDNCKYDSLTWAASYFFAQRPSGR